MTDKEREELEKELAEIDNKIWKYDHYRLEITRAEVDALMERGKEINRILYEV